MLDTAIDYKMAVEVFFVRSEALDKMRGEVNQLVNFLIRHVDWDQVKNWEKTCKKRSGSGNFEKAIARFPGSDCTWEVRVDVDAGNCLLVECWHFSSETPVYSSSRRNRAFSDDMVELVRASLPDLLAGMVGMFPSLNNCQQLR